MFTTVYTLICLQHSDRCLLCFELRAGAITRPTQNKEEQNGLMEREMFGYVSVHYASSGWSLPGRGTLPSDVCAHVFTANSLVYPINRH